MAELRLGRGLVVVTGLLALAASGCGKRYTIPSTGMMPTLQMGDRIAVRALEAGEPLRGDIVVYEFGTPSDKLPKHPMLQGARESTEVGLEFMKRVVAVAGDRVRLEDDVLFLNGQRVATERLGPTTCGIYQRESDPKPAAECACEHQRETIGSRTWETQHFIGDRCPFGDRTAGTWPQAAAPRLPYLGARTVNPSWPDVVVPDGYVLVLGDNRHAVLDSRYQGFVPLASIRGKATAVVSNQYDPTREDVPLE